MKSSKGKETMELIELETDFPKDRRKAALMVKTASLEKPLDLEPYFDFLDEIEAFDSPKKKPIDYPAEFEL